MKDTDPKYWLDNDEPLHWCWRFSGLTREDFMVRHVRDIEQFNAPYPRSNLPTQPLENNE